MVQPAMFAPSDRVWKLPPLILHPFSDANGPGKLVQSSRASLMLQGILPNNEFSAAELDQRLLDGRYCEIRMLYYVGKDVMRWLEQCQEIVARDTLLVGGKVKEQSFADMLIENPPGHVREKLKRWGVADYRAIFSRAIGLNMIFADVPIREALAPMFIRNYYRFADHMYTCFQQLQSFHTIAHSTFQFDLFASGEYSRLLAREWQGSLDPQPE